MGFYEVQITAKSFPELRALGEMEVDVKERAARQIDRNRISIPGFLTDEKIMELQKTGYEVDVVEDLSDIPELRWQEVSTVNRFAEEISADEMAARSLEGYMNVDEIEDAQKALSTKYPDLVTLIELPHKTWEGRTSHAVKVCGGDGTGRPGVFFSGSMHAREWGGSDICMSFLFNMIKAYQNGEGLRYGKKSFDAYQIKAIMEKLNIYVFPDVNPDGKHYSQTKDPDRTDNQGFWWRKNRNPNEGIFPPTLGVDVNRNFDFLWHECFGASANPAWPTYKGTGPFSEPETRNVRHMFDTYPDIGYYIDIHSYSKLFLYPWGDDDNQTSNPDQNFRNQLYNGIRGKLDDWKYREYVPPLDETKAVMLAHRMNTALEAVHERCYKIWEGSNLYPTIGTSSDYAYSRHLTDRTKTKVFGYTIEFGETFVPAYEEMRKIIKDVCSALTELCWTVVAE